MGHLGNLKQEYWDLAKRLNANVVGLPEPFNEDAWKGWQTILELLYSSREAFIGAKMPIFPTSLEVISKKCRVNMEELKSILDSMADKGIVMDIINPDTDEVLYSLSPPVYGFFELTFMKIGKEKVSKKELALAISAYCGNSDAFVREVHGAGKTALGRTLVYDSLLKEELIPNVYKWEKVVEVIESANYIALSKCYCRHKAEHLGQNCNAPIETCFSLNDFGEYIIRRNFGRAIDKSEAMDILLECRERGLVHTVDNVKSKPAWLCNCCKCCCGILKAINNYGFPALNTSNFIPKQSLNNCKACLKCIRACPVNALSLNKTNNTNSSTKLLLHVDEDRCIGCGICVNVCPQKTLILTKRLKPPFIPDSSMELLIERAFERGKLAQFVFDCGQGWGPTFLSFFLNVLSSFPVLKQLLVTRQLKSRFIRYIVNKDC